MRNHVFFILLLPGLLCAFASATSPDDFTKTVRPVLEEYCAKCHGAGDEIEGDVNLVELKAENLVENVELVRDMSSVLDLQEMPPEDEPQLAPNVRKQVIGALTAILHASTSTNRVPSAPVRRMNRFQYNNAVIDLFDLKCIVFTLPERMMREHKGYFKPASGKMAKIVHVGNRPLGKSQMIESRLAGVAAFPQDLRAEHGFDNRGDHLSLSPLLLESFLNLGQSITQSPDFVKRNIGIWGQFFAAPELAGDESMEEELRRRLEPFLSRAFRRTVQAEQLDRYVGFVTNQLDAGVDFAMAMKSVAAATISSPRFFYLYDSSTDSDDVEELNDFELASRLSFFLWGSIPDQTLLDLAAKGELNDSAVLSEQFHRMIKDRKLKRFCDSFPAQWLQLDRLISSTPAKESFPKFYNGKYRLSMHMMMEPLLLFETVLIEDLPISQLIDSDFTYQSRLLQNAYGELGNKEAPASKGNQVTQLTFARLPVADRRIGGVITNGAVMTMTSGPERTKPITRGAWIASVIFNSPPDPPPADVPPLDEKPPAGEEDMTLRERLSMHRERADCKGCHEKIDPLGFALENYGPIGGWRDSYENGRDVDMQGTLFREHAFNDVVEFKDAILVEKDRFARAFAGHLLSFALARELAASDENALDEMVKATVADEYRMQSLLEQVILSEPFHRKSNPMKPEDSKSRTDAKAESERK